METHLNTDKRHLIHVAVNPLAMAQVGGQLIAMRVEKVDHRGLFLSSATLIWPRTVFEIFLCLSSSEAPIRAACSSTYVERGWGGFGIAVEISSMSGRDQERWSAFVREAARTDPSTYGRGVSALQTAQSASITVVSLALSDRLLAGLRMRGLKVQQVETTADALEIVQEPGKHTIVAEQHGDYYDGTDLCRRLSEHGESVQSVLLTNQRKPHILELSLYAGATKVVARPCSQEILLLRLLDMVASHTEQEATAQARSAEAEPAERSLLQQLSQWAAACVHTAQEWLNPAVAQDPGRSGSY